MTMDQSAAAPLVEAAMADAPVPRRRIVMIVARAAAVVLGVLALYGLVPVREETSTAVAAMAVAGLVVVAVVFARQLGRIGRSRRPVLAAIEALVLVVTLFVVLFAFLYVSLSAGNPDSFTQPVGKVAGIYFTVTILGTVGFGDIAAVADQARIAVTIQMVLDLVLIGVAVKVIGNSARRRVSRLASEVAADENVNVPELVADVIGGAPPGEGPARGAAPGDTSAEDGR